MTRSGPAATQPAPTRMVSGMGRLHLIEFHEQDWFPAPIRNGLRAVLQKISSTLPGYEAITEVLLEAMKVPDSGPIGLEGDRGQMEYRRIRIKSLE